MSNIFRSARSKIKSKRIFTPIVGIDDDWVDAFGRLRVSNTATLFESSFTYDKQPLLFEEATENGGLVVHDSDSGSLLLSTTAVLGSRAVMQSRSYIPYEKGKSQLIKMTGVLGTPQAGAVSRVGYFDDSDGFYLEQSETGLNLVRRSSVSGAVVETRIPQSQWNIDTMDGLGPSGITLDMSKPQILVIDGQWLGVGRVRVGFNIDGLNFNVHEFLHANVSDMAPYTKTFTLPVRYEVETVEAGGSTSLRAICADVESEGGVDNPSGFAFSASTNSSVSTGTAASAVISIRPAAEFPASSGVVNRTLIIPNDISAILATENCLLEVHYDAELSGGTWATVDPNSAVEVGTGQALVSPGVVVQSIFAPAAERNNVFAGAGDSIRSQYPLTLDMQGLNPKNLTLVARTLSGTGTIRAAINWREIR